MKKLLLALLLVANTICAQVTITMEREAGVYKVPCVVNGAKMKFIFDTGAATVCLSESMAEYLLDNDYISKDDFIGTGSSTVADGRSVSHLKIILRDIEIAGLHLKDVEASVVEGQRAPLLLGQTAIQKLGKVAIDGNKLIIENGNEADCQPDNSGETIARMIEVANSSWCPDFAKGTYYLRLGNCYYYGKCVSIDYKTAADWYEKAAINGNTEGMTSYASCLYDGLGRAIDYSSAVYWYKKAAERDDPFALYSLGWMYRIGQGVAVDMIKGFDYARLAVVKSDEDFADARTALVPYFEYFLQLARQGHSTGFFYSGLCYTYGYGTTQNFTEALYWYKKGAENGDVDCMNNLANIFRYGQGTDIDFSQAIYWYKKAANTGSPKAQENLGDMYYYGIGVNRDYLTAYKWYSMAAEENLVKAQNKMGMLFYYGWGVQQDYSKAFIFFSKASANNDVEASSYLGNMYRYGYGVNKDITKAVQFYERSTDYGWSNYFLAQIYKNGELGYTDLSQYRYYMEQCWKKNKLTYAMNELAYDYALGQYGTKKDLNCAIKIIDEAVELEPNEPNYYDSKGEFYSMQGKYKEAKEMWLKVKSLDTTFYTKHNSELNKYIQKQVK